MVSYGQQADGGLLGSGERSAGGEEIKSAGGDESAGILIFFFLRSGSKSNQNFFLSLGDSNLQFSGWWNKES